MYGPGAAEILCSSRPWPVSRESVALREGCERVFRHPAAGRWYVAEGQCPAGTYDFSLEIPVAALADDSGMSHDFLIKRLDERIKGERFGIIDQWLVLYLFQCNDFLFGKGMLRPEDDFQMFFIEMKKS